MPEPVPDPDPAPEPAPAPTVLDVGWKSDDRALTASTCDENDWSVVAAAAGGKVLDCDCECSSADNTSGASAEPDTDPEPDPEDPEAERRARPCFERCARTSSCARRSAAETNVARVDASGAWSATPSAPTNNRFAVRSDTRFSNAGTDIATEGRGTEEERVGEREPDLQGHKQEDGAVVKNLALGCDSRVLRHWLFLTPTAAAYPPHCNHSFPHLLVFTDAAMRTNGNVPFRFESSHCAPSTREIADHRPTSTSTSRWCMLVGRDVSIRARKVSTETMSMRWCASGRRACVASGSPWDREYRVPFRT
jgi:hypothetical protein